MVTLHSIERTTERTGLNRKASVRMMENAYNRGIDANQFSTVEKEYLERKADDGTIIKYYAGYCFIFSCEGLCITMYKAPTWFGKRHFDGKNRIRNLKKYNKKYYFDQYNESSDWEGMLYGSKTKI
ncbi:hypothetical protein SAMN02910413_1177 [Pseudobutyrivibrio sp. C4]|uniref:hypothetical protein n=1 Tax=Pseudobutyrivibrio sp. C4 TaxID=1520803 RepID=UPI0008CEC0C5|nr:hypothetical protein [Pseudobutyrivibrio sp. C4]SES90161.1 hypothetical protein SAMN02910413_1177 [Pseudobutyrivibrio sp. C4]